MHTLYGIARNQVKATYSQSTEYEYYDLFLSIRGCWYVRIFGFLAQFQDVWTDRKYVLQCRKL